MLLENCESNGGASGVLPGQLGLLCETERVKTMPMLLGESEYLPRSCVISPSQSKDIFRDSLEKIVN